MKKGDFDCQDHGYHHGVMDGPPHHEHPGLHEGKASHYYDGILDEHTARGAPHPKHHTRGKMRAQMNPDHGPHRGAGKHV